MLEQYATFFTASTTSAATLVGLLFVVLSIDVDLEKNFRIKRYVVSETAFITLGGIFIISLLATLPSGIELMAAANIIFAIAGIWFLLHHTVHFDEDIFRPIDRWFRRSTISTYLLLATVSIWILATQATIVQMNILCVLMLILYGLSLIRAWRTLIITKHKTSK